MPSTGTQFRNLWKNTKNAVLGTKPKRGNEWSGGSTDSQQGHITSPTPFQPRPQRTDSVDGNYGSNTGATAGGTLHRTGLQGQGHTIQPHPDQVQHTGPQAVGGDQGSNTVRDRHDRLQRPADPPGDRPWWAHSNFQGINPSQYYTDTGNMPIGGGPPSLVEQRRQYNTGRPQPQGNQALPSHQSNLDGDLNASNSDHRSTNRNGDQGEDFEGES